MFTNESEASAESEAYDSASVVPIHTRLELSSDSDSAYDSASVASVNQPISIARYDLVKIKPSESEAEGYSAYDSVAYDLVKTRLSESQALFW